MQRDSDQLRDELLVMDWQDGRREAMEAMVHRWQRRLIQHAHRLTQDEDGALEAVQEAWMAMVRGIGRLDDPARFRYWAYRIVTNKSCDWIRRRQRDRIDRLASEAAVPDTRADHVRRVDSDDTVEALLDSLSTEHRTAVSLRFVEEFSIREIAQTLRIPEGTVKSRLHAALSHLKRKHADRTGGKS